MLLSAAALEVIEQREQLLEDHFGHVGQVGQVHCAGRHVRRGVRVALVEHVLAAVEHDAPQAVAHAVVGDGTRTRQVDTVDEAREAWRELRLHHDRHALAMSVLLGLRIPHDDVVLQPGRHQGAHAARAPRRRLARRHFSRRAVLRERVHRREARAALGAAQADTRLDVAVELGAVERGEVTALASVERVLLHPRARVGEHRPAVWLVQQRERRRLARHLARCLARRLARRA